MHIGHFSTWLSNSRAARLAWGALLAVGVALTVELLVMAGVYLPTIAPFFLAAVVLATLAGGTGAGILCGLLSIAYYVRFYTGGGYLPSSPYHVHLQIIDLSVVTLALVPMITTAKRGLAAKERAQTIRSEAHRIAKRFENVIQQLEAIIWEAEPARGKFLFVSQHAEAMLGYPLKRWMDGGEAFFLSIVHPDDRQSVVERLHRAAADNDPELDLEHRMLTADGRTRWVRNLVRVVSDADGKPVHRYGVIIDTTAQRRVEEALRISGARLQTLFDHASDPMLVFHLNDDGSGGPLAEVNDAATTLTGYTRRELLHMSASQLADSVVLNKQRMDELRQASPRLFECTIVNKAGRMIPVEAHMHLFELNNKPTVLSICRDISVRKEAEEALRQSEQRERARAAEVEAILKAVPALVWIARNEGSQKITGSRASYEFLQPPAASDALGVGALRPDVEDGQRLRFKVLDAEGREIPPDQLPVQRAATDGVEVRNFEGQIVFETGATRHFFGNATPLRDDKGNVNGAVAAFVDISARKRVMEELRELNQTLEQRVRERTAQLAESQSMYKAMGDSAPFGVWMCDARGEVQYLSQSFLDLTEMTMDQARDHGWTHRLPPEDIGPTMCKWRACVAAGSDWEIEHRILGPTGRYHTVLSRGKPVRDKDDRIVCWTGINLDITERKRMEQQLRDLNEALRERADQLRALASELTQTEKRERERIARILHDDLQQILAAAKIRLTRLSETHAGDQEHESITQVEHLLDRSIDISRSLTTELSPPQLHDGGLAPALEWIARWMHEQHQVTVHLNLDEHAEPGDLDVRVLLFEAVRELLFNSVKHAKVSQIWVVLETIGDRLQITVEDKGCGFDPQSVTRESGFGLLSIRERLNLFEGELLVNSAPGQGTRMILRAPRYRLAGRDRQAATDPERIAENPRPGGAHDDVRTVK